MRAGAFSRTPHQLGLGQAFCCRACAAQRAQGGSGHHHRGLPRLPLAGLPACSARSRRAHRCREAPSSVARAEVGGAQAVASAKQGGLEILGQPGAESAAGSWALSRALAAAVLCPLLALGFAQAALAEEGAPPPKKGLGDYLRQRNPQQEQRQPQKQQQPEAPGGLESRTAPPLRDEEKKAPEKEQKGPEKEQEKERAAEKEKAGEKEKEKESKGAEGEVKPPDRDTKPLKELVVPESVLSKLSQEEQQTVNLFQKNTPSVVNIANFASARGFYMNEEVQQGLGSGFVWDERGHIVTNYHVVRAADSLKITLIDSSVFPAKLIGGDPDKDVAVLQLIAPPEKLRELKPVTLGTSANLLVGQKTFAIGNPFGLDHTLTQGIVSGLGRELATPGFRGVPIKNVIQTDAAFNPGNSGGVLLDSGGRLIGINTAIADPTGRGSNSGVGFAIPIDTAKGLVEQILQFGRVVRPVLGVSIAPPQVLRQLGEEGVLILDVPPGSPASKAGLKPTYRDEAGRLIIGDILTGIDGRPVKTQRDLFEGLDEKRPGDRVRIEVTRDQKKREVEVVLGERAAQGAE